MKAAYYVMRVSKLFSSAVFVWAMSKKELRMKYSGSRLGLWWAVFLPLILALTINLIFTRAFYIAIPNYAIFVLSCILPWIFFSQSLSEATNSFLNNLPILKQAVFLKETVPLSSILGNFLNFLIGLAAVLPLFLLYNYRIIFLLPVLAVSLVSLLLLICGLGFIFSVTNVFYRDVSYFLSLGFMIWFWLTPIFYSLDMIPYPYKIICLANPITYFMVNFRELLYYGRMDIKIILINSCISIVTFLAGYYIFLVKEHELSKRL